MDQAQSFYLKLLSNGSLSIFLPLNCNMRQKDYSASDRRMLDMVLGPAMSWLWLWHVGFDFSCHVVGGCVCLGLDQCFWGSTECAEEKKIRETTMSIYSNQGCIFS